jgi:hypothetical protein
MATTFNLQPSSIKLPACRQAGKQIPNPNVEILNKLEIQKKKSITPLSPISHYLPPT